jgi:hypothetical protein
MWYVLNGLSLSILSWLCQENLAATHNFQTKPQFLLAYDSEAKLWTVEVGHSWSFDPRARSGFTHLVGQGSTPELAYQEVLTDTAIMVSDREYAFCSYDASPWA